MELQAVTGQLFIVNGESKTDTPVPGILAQPAPAKSARGREHDSLFVHLSLQGNPDETAVLSQDLLDAISLRYFQSTGGVTSALRRAVIEANELLLRLNLSGTGHSREGAISCAVLHRGDLYLVQTGEALAMLGHNFGVERLPQKAPDRITPLGRSAGIDIRYFHHRLQSGNMLLLADPRIGHMPTQELAPALVDSEVETGLAYLREAVADDSAQLLLVEFTFEAPSDLPDIEQTIQRATKALAGVTLPIPRRSSASSAPSPAAEQQKSPGRGTAIPLDDEYAHDAPDSEPMLNVEQAARRATSEAAMGLSRFTDWLVSLLTRLRPNRTQDKQVSDWKLPALLAVVIPILVAVVVTSVYLQRGRVRRFSEIKREMGQQIALAEGVAPDNNMARESYAQVLTLAAEAETLRPRDQEIQRLMQQAVTSLDRLDDITRLNAAPFYQFSDRIELWGVTLREGHNGGMYVLDGANTAIYQIDTDEDYLGPTADPQPILTSGQSVGNQVVSPIVDMMWRTRGESISRDGLSALDRNGVLFTFYPNFSDIRSVQLSGFEEWQVPVAITTFGERMYILDAGANKIWKYYPDGDGFTVVENERTIEFSENPELNRAVDLSIYSEDGSLLVLYGDGRIRYYDTRSGRIQWDEAGLLDNGLNSPLVSPTVAKIIGRGLNASIFVADPGSGRIVQLSRGGIVLAQFRATAEDGGELFARLTDFTVTEAPMRIFAAVDNTLYVASQN